MTDVLHRPTAKAGGGPPPGSRGGGEATGAPFYDTAASLLRHGRIMIAVPAVTFFLAVGFAVLTRDYAATSRLTPQNQESGLSSLIGVVAQLGVTAPVGRQNESVDFYADLIKTREVLDSLARTRFRFTTGENDEDTLSGTYLDLYKVTGRTDFDRMYSARRLLEGKVSTTVKRSSGIVTIQTRAKWGLLAEQMNRRILDLVNQLTLQRRQAAARAEREDLDRSLAEMKTQMEEAQAALRSFQERNRSWRSDPTLSREMENRQRHVDEAQQNYESSLQRYRQARSEEIWNTPVITIVESPESSRKRSGGLLLSGGVGLFAGLMLAVGLSLSLDYAATERSRNPDAYETFRRLWVSGPGRFFARRPRSPLP